MMNRSNSKPKKATKPTKSADDSLFLKHQIREEKQLSELLGLDHKMQEKLQSRHSMSAFFKFIQQYKEEIRKGHYLYELPQCLDTAHSVTFKPTWCETDKKVYVLDSYSYCLFTRKEYKLALSNNISKDVFIDIKRKKTKPVKSDKKAKKNKSPKKSSKQTVYSHVKEYEQEEDEDCIIDVLSQESPSSVSMDDRKVVDVTPQPEPVIILESKREIPNHIEEIIQYNGSFEQEEAQEEEKESLVLVKSTKKGVTPERRLTKRYREEDGALEELRSKIERINHHNKLERELRDVQNELMLQRVQIMERRFDSLLKSSKEKDQEIQTLKRVQKQQLSAANAFPLAQQQQQDPNAPKRKRVAAPRARKAKSTTNDNQAPPHTNAEQGPLDQFMIVPFQQQQQQPIEVDPVPEMPVAIVDPTQTPEFIAQQAQFLAQIEAEQNFAATSLTPFTNEGISNIGVGYTYRYKLADYLNLLLATVRNPTVNHHIRDILAHPYINNYKITLLPNMTLTPPCNMSPHQLAQHVHMQRAQVLDATSLQVRLNLSVVHIHSWFLSKSIKYATLAETGEIAYTPVVLSNFQYSYAPEILKAWYPYMDAGNGCIVMHDLKIPATPTQHGQGRGKHCHFCDFEYIAGSEGKLKHAHQLKNCDFIANLSNDERVILTVVLEKRRTSLEFAKHVFIRHYDQKGLLRRATPQELTSGRFVVCPRTGDKLRINMPILLNMRKRCYTRFLDRITSLDTHDLETDDKLKNLDAKPIVHQLDCFTHFPPRPSFSFQVQQSSTTTTTTTTAKSRAKKASTTSSVSLFDRNKKAAGFLYKTLLDYDGKQFVKSKIASDGKTPLRTFTIDQNTGFGDGMFFSCTYDRVPPLYPVINAMPAPPSLGDQVNALYALYPQQPQQQQEILYLTADDTTAAAATTPAFVAMPVLQEVDKPEEKEEVLVFKDTPQPLEEDRNEFDQEIADRAEIVMLDDSTANPFKQFHFDNEQGEDNSFLFHNSDDQDAYNNAMGIEDMFNRRNGRRNYDGSYDDYDNDY